MFPVGLLIGGKLAIVATLLSNFGLACSFFPPCTVSRSNDQRVYLVGKLYEVEKRNNSLKQVDNVCTPYLESKSEPTNGNPA
jgi:hypothetical protein